MSKQSINLFFIKVVLNFCAGTDMLTWNGAATFASDFDIDPTKTVDPCNIYFIYFT